MKDKLENTQINDLRHKRRLIRQQLKTRSVSGDKNKDAQKLLAKYLEYTKILSELGFNQPHTAYYLEPSYWENKNNNKDIPIKPKIQLSAQKTPKTTETKINIVPEQSYYIFNLAWTCVNSSEQTDIISTIKSYYEKIGAILIENESFNYGEYRKEDIIKFELKCTPAESIIIRKSAQFIIDNFCDEDIVKQNTSVYTNKKHIN